MFDIAKPSVSKWEEIDSALNSILNHKELDCVEAKISSAQVSRSRVVSKEFLSKLWSVPEKLSEKSIERNTQLRRQSKDNPLSRNHTTNYRMLRCKLLQSVLFTDIMFAAKHKSIRGNNFCQVFVSDKLYVAVHPMKSQHKFETTLYWFCKKVGLLVDHTIDRFSAQKKLSLKRFFDQVGTAPKMLKRATPWEN